MLLVKKIGCGFDMRKVVAFLLIAGIIFSCGSAFAETKAPDIKSASAILMHEDSGRILYEKDADKKLYPASTTKIMTALLAVENLDPQKELTISETAIDIDRDGSNMGLLNGEVLTVEQLLYGLLVHSANDAANALGEAVSGELSAFVDAMNVRAAELGMTNTHFVNAHGYHDEEHYTTARDLLTLSVAAMEHPLIRQIVATATYEIPPTNKYTEPRILSNSNCLVNQFRDHRYVYNGAAGIKTGHTSDAGSCLASYAERGGRGFFCVTLSAPVEYEGNYSFLDTMALFDYAFGAYSLQTVSNTSDIVTTHDIKWGRGTDQVILSAKEPLEVLLPKGYDKAKLTTDSVAEENIVAPVKKGDVLGRLTYYYDGDEIGSVDLVATQDIGRSFFKMIFVSLFNFIFGPWVMIPLALFVVLSLLHSMHEAKKRRIAREKRREQARRNFYQ